MNINPEDIMCRSYNHTFLFHEVRARRIFIEIANKADLTVMHEAYLSLQTVFFDEHNTESGGIAIRRDGEIQLIWLSKAQRFRWNYCFVLAVYFYDGIITWELYLRCWLVKWRYFETHLRFFSGHSPRDLFRCIFRQLMVVLISFEGYRIDDSEGTWYASVKCTNW